MHHDLDNKRVGYSHKMTNSPYQEVFSHTDYAGIGRDKVKLHAITDMKAPSELIHFCSLLSTCKILQSIRSQNVVLQLKHMYGIPARTMKATVRFT